MVENRLSSGLEDYLECIYNNIQNKGSVKAIDISRELNVSRASVTDALKRLASKGYISYERYGKINLLDTGIEKSQTVIEKHQILTTFFEKILKLSKKEATENACRIEHVITENAFTQLKRFLND
ncbi:TPA: iron-dependent transcriptional regulator [Candidatus Gastranaerophilales bacterium HUM_9]|nr:MAG TPA: iron-dependent transcriptional regulator [Candidatus Gastranaerophilales bacterium HUM_9]HBX35197.1 metal-dependent transcriptional regulator [Cyanobacteria bacterium UBA11440]